MIEVPPNTSNPAYITWDAKLETVFREIDMLVERIAIFGRVPLGMFTQKDAATIPEAAKALKLTAHDLMRLGIIDEIANGELREAAIAFARELLESAQPLRRTGSLQERVSDIDAVVFDDCRKRIERRARGQLAPWKAIEAIEAACRMPFADGMQFEREKSLECIASPQRQALIHVFKAERAAAGVPGAAAETEPLPIRRAAVIGAGTMGGGIAMSFAHAGIPVTLIDVSAEALVRGRGIIEKNYAASVSRGSLGQADADQALALISTDTDYEPVASVDIVIEAVFEDMELKQNIFRQLDAAAPAGAILATNTSSLDIDEIAAATNRADHVAGMHFFSPAHIMKLLENVRGTKTSTQVLVTIMLLAKRLGKIPVLAGNCDGFIGNRMLQFYTGGAEYLLEEGATPEQIDHAMEEFGFPMGPCAMRDLAGNDVGMMIRRARAPSLPKEERLSPILERLVEMGRLGQKSGKGFYLYEGRIRMPDPQLNDFFAGISNELGIERRDIDADEIRARLLHPLVNEGARVLEDGIALRAGDIDVVYCHGYGFPKYRGGPMYWAEREGLEHVRQTLERLSARFGPRYAPAARLVRCMENGTGWDCAGSQCESS